MPFTALGLAPTLAQAAAQLGWTTPTAIQSSTLPVVLSGADLLATAPTGSGKTAAFVLPLLQLCLSRTNAERLRATTLLVLVPTRELAAQIFDVIQQLTQSLESRPKVVTAVGGVSINPQMMDLRGGADVVVATPGRLLDLVDHNALSLSEVQHLVLDEADRLLDLGFANELDRVLALLPKHRQTLLFSATFPAVVEQLASRWLIEPKRIAIAGPSPGPATIEQRVILVDASRRAQLVRKLIREHGWERVLVFVASQYAADHLARKLHQGELYATSFHGGLSQGARRQALGEFKQQRWDVLVTTDLAARGLDVEQLPVVINFDLPRSATDHTHRIGRTGRAGAPGLAISLVSPETEAHWRLIARRQDLTGLPIEVLPGFEPTESAPTNDQDLQGTGGIKGKRPSKKDKLRAAAALTNRPLPDA
ncbi:DEAD/DEAH box helicase [Hydrogenophaga sp.]|uniref:DEAD/DEAH box helicase n=1 Tax=Hydrogenophaga sp. TaxID=1904254 RepID=UPI0025C64C00|nr:DEAD/DEAH box helicase [Hydrogenophaga sp.]